LAIAHGDELDIAVAVSGGKVVLVQNEHVTLSEQPQFGAVFSRDEARFVPR
jgi:hypothetical protein